MLLAHTFAFLVGVASTYAFVTPSPGCFRTSASASASTTTQIMASSSSTPKSGDVVTVTYSLIPEGDFVTPPLFDDGTVSFVLNGGNYLPGLHDLVSKMSVGEKREGISLDAGWGERRDDLVAKVPIASSGINPSDLKVGMGLFLANGVECKVVELDDENFTIDANPPMAGSNYQAKVALDSFSSGPSDAKFGYNSEAVVDDDNNYDVLTIALGCFWGGELAYQRENGVVGTSVGYTQGEKVDPSYQEVCSGTTGHTEAIQVIFDSSVVSYEDLVRVGMERLGDSRTLVNQVGNDRGTQYRHGVYYHNDEQKAIADAVIASYDGGDCVTECMEATKYYKAEDYHQQYLLKGGQSARKDNKDTIRCYG